MPKSMQLFKRLIYCSIIFCLSCQATRTVKVADDGQIEVIFLQVNDVYEIAPLEGGKVGGMARVATVKKQLLQQNPNTYTVMAGDFLNPSVIGNIKYDGSRIRGKHMVEVMNAAGVDFATFGNHEFDIKEEELLQRLHESKFKWLSSNVLHRKGDSIQPFTSGTPSVPVPRTFILNATDKDGTSIRIGMLGLTLPSNKVDFVVYEDVAAKASEAYHTLEKQVDVIIAITHLDIEDDLAVSQQNPGIRLLMGGHEHTNSYDTVGTAIVAKADANAKTVYVHTLSYDKKAQQAAIRSSLISIDTTLAPDPQTASVVNKWTSIADKSFKELGFNPQEVLFVTSEPLEGRESYMRKGPTNLGKLIAKSISASAPQAELALLNSGSIRIDDQLQGTISQYDILRALPFGGKIVEADIQGNLLEKILTTGAKNAGNGGYLQTDKVEYDMVRQTWLIGGKLLDTNKTYRVALSDYLITGLESNFGFLKAGNQNILKIYEPNATDKLDLRNDIRSAVIAYLKSLNK
jgi:2',3'-cyclic-nucleotide 2'-phosphodiesterase (5'-nucleotidase family)